MYTRLWSHTYISFITSRQMLTNDCNYCFWRVCFLLRNCFSQVLPFCVFFFLFFFFSSAVTLFGGRDKLHSVSTTARCTHTLIHPCREKRKTESRIKRQWTPRWRCVCWETSCCVIIRVFVPSSLNANAPVYEAEIFIWDEMRGKTQLKFPYREWR